MNDKIHNEHSGHSASERGLRTAFVITLVLLLAETAGGYISNSLALLSDAGHVLTDTFALGLSLVAARLSAMPASDRATFGYQRVGLMAAVINGASLVVIAVFIFYESWKRFMEPPVVDLAVMLPIAAAGLLANIVMVVMLGHEHEDMNVKSAWLHVLGDTLASIGVIVSGVIIYFTGWRYADPVASVFIGGVIVAGGARVVWEAARIFLDFAPAHIKLDAVTAGIMSVEHVKGMHDVHLRSLTHGRVAFEAHVYVSDMMLSEAGKVRSEIEQKLLGMGVAHVTIQLECADCADEGPYCRQCGHVARQ